MTKTVREWKVFKASSEKFLPVVRDHMKAQGFEEWYGSVDNKDVPPGIWENYRLENVAGNTELRVLGFKEAPDAQA